MIRKLNQLITCAIFGTLGLQQLDAQEEKKEIFVDLQFIPVGPVALAKFGTTKTPTALPREEGEGKEKKESSGVPTQGGQVIVLEQPKDEIPPQQIFYKVKKQYIRIGSNLNCLGTPVRVPVVSEELNFYTRFLDQEGNYKYKSFHTHTWSPGQKNLLFILSKSFKTKKWTRPKVNTYDLSPLVSKDTGLVIINASQEQIVKLIAGKKRGSISPHKMQYFSGDKELSVALAATNKGKTLRPFKRTFPMRPGSIQLLLTYPVTMLEDYHGLKYVQDKIKIGSFQEPSYVPDE